MAEFLTGGLHMGDLSDIVINVVYFNLESMYSVCVYLHVLLT